MLKEKAKAQLLNWLGVKEIDKLRVINFILSVTALLLAIRNAVVR